MDFTFETHDRTTRLEKYEWDHVWWEDTDNMTSPRVLYIGDSISCGLRRPINRVADGAILFDNFATSKALDNPYFKESILNFAKQQPHCEAVLFNNAAHGFHLADETDFRAHYERMCVFLKEQFCGKPVILLSGSYVKSDRCARMKKRSEIAAELAEKYGFYYIDVFSKTAEMKDRLSDDGIHFTEEGYEILADFLYKKVKEIGLNPQETGENGFAYPFK